MKPSLSADLRTIKLQCPVMIQWNIARSEVSIRSFHMMVHNCLNHPVVAVSLPEMRSFLAFVFLRQYAMQTLRSRYMRVICWATNESKGPDLCVLSAIGAFYQWICHSNYVPITGWPYCRNTHGQRVYLLLVAWSLILSYFLGGFIPVAYSANE